jgi:hypothetical protein
LEGRMYFVFFDGSDPDPNAPKSKI